MYDKFDSHSIEIMRKAVEAALEPLGKKFGMEFKLGKVSYNAQSFSGDLTCVIGSLSDKEKEDFNRLCGSYNLAPEHYGFEFESGNTVYKLVGFNTKAPKYPYVLIRVADSSKVRGSEPMIVNNMLVQYNLKKKAGSI